MVYIFYLLSYLILFYFSSAFTFAPSCASPINTAESIVNTYAWMKATNSSSAFIKILNSTEATVSVPFSAGPILAEMKIRQDRKSTRLNSSHPPESRMPSSA